MTLVEKTRDFVAENIGNTFHQRRLRKLKKTQLAQLMARRDTMLLRAQAPDSGRTLVRLLLDGHASAADASLFNDFMKTVAVFVATEAHGGTPPRADSVDVEFARDGRHYALAVKSRSGWGSAGQVSKMVEAFRAGAAEGRPTDVTFLLGCLQGEGSSSPATDCEKMCGPDFWRFISGESDFDSRLVECLDVDTSDHVKKYKRAYKSTLKTLAEEFERDFCDAEGHVQWQAVAKFDPATAAEAAKDDESGAAGDAPHAEAAPS